MISLHSFFFLIHFFGVVWPQGFDTGGRCWLSPTSPPNHPATSLGQATNSYRQPVARSCSDTAMTTSRTGLRQTRQTPLSAAIDEASSETV